MNHLMTPAPTLAPPVLPSPNVRPETRPYVGSPPSVTTMLPPDNVSLPPPEPPRRDAPVLAVLGGLGIAGAVVLGIAIVAVVAWQIA